MPLSAPGRSRNHHPDGADAVFTGDRGSAVTAMAAAFERFVTTRGDLAGAIGVGGSGGTALITPALRTLPVGVPKIMVSTVASGDVSGYVGAGDIAMLHSVTDVAGLNQISRQVLGNAAHALAGMLTNEVPAADTKPAVALTMFGVTTPCVTAVAEQLGGAYECLVFHATGTGGRTMEKLVDDGQVSAVLHITTTEVCDLVAGGVFSASEDRLDAIARTRVPYLGSCGALDMVNFGARETVPERYRDRNLYVHNPAGDAHAHHCRGVPPDRGVPRPQAQRLRRPGALPAARGRRVAARRARASRSTIRRPTRCCSRPWSATWCRPQTGACPVAAQHQRSRVHRCPRRSVHRGDTMRSTRAELVERFRDMADRGELIVGGGAGTGLSAKCEEAGGIDLIVIYNSGRYRMAGRRSLAGLLAYGNANEIVVEMAAEVLPVVAHTPVLAGVNGTDPFLLRDRFLHELRDLGFAGVQNFPTVGLIDGVFRANLEETGMGYGLEVDLVAAARDADLPTTPYVFSAADARAMALAGADMIVCHMGLTTGGVIGAETAKTLDDCVALIDEWAAAALDVRDDVLMLCHGGPIATPADATHVLDAARHCKGSTGRAAWSGRPPSEH